VVWTAREIWALSALADRDATRVEPNLVDRHRGLLAVTQQAQRARFAAFDRAAQRVFDQGAALWRRSHKPGAAGLH
jgi:hypothetical protein